MLDSETIRMLEEIGFVVDDEDSFGHKGVSVRDGAPVGSGRWPLGFGDHPFQHDPTFVHDVNKMRKEKFTYYDAEKDKVLTKDNAIAKYYGLTSTQFRAKYGYLAERKDQQEYDQIMTLREKGYTNKMIADELGLPNESSVRSKLKAKSMLDQSKSAKNIAEVLKKEEDKKGIIYVGEGVPTSLGISKEKMEEALYVLQEAGYPVYTGRHQQTTNKNQSTIVKGVCPPGTEYKEIYDPKNIHFIDDKISYDGGLSFKKSFYYPESLDSKRLQIRYNEEGGIDKDGVIEIRPGVKDLSLGDSAYAQVRIMVDGTHYLKGMAVYNDNLPKGVDVLFNTNKHTGTPLKDVLKEIKQDPDNPFGSLIKEHGGQSFYDDPNGKFTDETTGKKQSLSLINKRADAGDWDEWSNHLPAQFLAKQNLKLVDRQLKIAIDNKNAEFDEIMSCNNPEVKRVLLNTFAQDCDSAAVKLHAASLPRQRYQVILPLTTIGDDEVYAPNYRGEGRNVDTVALIRFPHASTSEIPILKVNNTNAEGKKVIGPHAPDAIGISAKVAQRLSGADFDGDTVLVIPCSDKVTIDNTPQLRALQNFEAKDEYGTVKTKDKNGNEAWMNPKTGKIINVLSKENTQKEMGKVSNLLMDMALFGADPETEVAPVLKHSMVIIDANKHHLDWKQSEKDNDIKKIKETYQGVWNEETNRMNYPAASLITRAKSEVRVPKRQGNPHVNKETGELEYKTADEKKLYYIDKKTGKKTMRLEKSTQMAEAKDATTLISDRDTPIERAYANYANTMKSLANKARKEALPIYTEKLEYSSEAAKIYKKEVDELKKQVKEYKLNKPKELKANLLANMEVQEKIEQYGLDYKGDKKEIAKLKQKAITNARLKTGAKRIEIDPTDKQWEAIQAKAVTATTLREVLEAADMDKIRERTIPRANVKMTDSMVKRAQTLREAVNLDGTPKYTISQIADALGVATSTVRKHLRID